MIHKTLIASLLAIACFPAGADEASDAVLERYFDAIGGRSIWANGHGEYVLAKVKDPGFPLPATFEFCWSWDGPRAADRSRFQGLTQIRSYTGTDGWTFRKPSGELQGTITTWDDARKARGQSEWNGNFEVLTHRIAKRDARVTTRLGEGPWKAWIEIAVSGDVVAYLLTDDRGSPKKFYRVFDEASVVFGSLVERGKIKFPAWGAFEGGEPFDLIAFEILDSAPVRPFNQPAVDDLGYLHCG
jgi:hypothetical protein